MTKVSMHTIVFSRASCLLALVLAGATIGGCSRSGASTPSRLMLTGSSTIAPIMTEIGKVFEKRHPNVRVEVQMGGSSRGIKDARENLADVGMVSRIAKPDERDLQFQTIALDGVGLIAHASNPVTNLTREQVVGIYTGKITNWKEVGGPDAPFMIVNKAEGRSTLELFCDHFKVKPSDIKASVVIGDNQQGIKSVGSDKTAIGYVSIGTAEFSIKDGVPIKLLKLDGIEASTETLKAGKYPLSRPLNLVTKTTPVGNAKELIDFARSAAVHPIIVDQGFVALND